MMKESLLSGSWIQEKYNRGLMCK